MSILRLYVFRMMRACAGSEARWLRWEPGGGRLTFDCWLHCWLCPPVLSSLCSPRSVTSYKSNNKNAVTAISASLALTVNLSLIVFGATNEVVFIKHRNISAWKYFLRNNPALLIFCFTSTACAKHVSSSFQQSRITQGRQWRAVVTL